MLELFASHGGSTIRIGALRGVGAEIAAYGDLEACWARFTRDKPTNGAVSVSGISVEANALLHSLYHLGVADNPSLLPGALDSDDLAEFFIGEADGNTPPVINQSFTASVVGLDHRLTADGPVITIHLNRTYP